MVRSVKLRWASSHYRLPQDDGVRVRFDVVCATGLSTRIFAYRMEPVDTDGTAHGFFSHICSPVDLAEYPANGPTPGKSPEWFRLPYVDVFLRSVQEAEDFIEIVKADVRRLIRTLHGMDTIFTNGTEVVGDIDCQPVEESSDSSSGETPSSASFGDSQTAFATGTTEQNVGTGVSWRNVGIGAGSQVLSDDTGDNFSWVTLQTGESSKLLLVQGFDFSDLPDDAVIEGIESQLVLRDATNDPTLSGSLGYEFPTSEDSLPADCPHISFVALQHPEFGMSENRSVSNCIDNSDWEAIQHGGDGDLWGLPISSGRHLLGRDLKDGAFGLGLIIANSSHGAATVAVDGVKLTVTYREEL